MRRKISYIHTCFNDDGHRRLSHQYHVGKADELLNPLLLHWNNDLDEHGLRHGFVAFWTHACNVSSVEVEVQR